MISIFLGRGEIYCFAGWSYIRTIFEIIRNTRAWLNWSNLVEIIKPACRTYSCKPCGKGINFVEIWVEIVSFSFRNFLCWFSTCNLFLERHPSLDKCSLLSPLDGLDYLFSPRTSKSPDISHVDPVYVAEQLTYWDAVRIKFEINFL